MKIGNFLFILSALLPLNLLAFEIQKIDFFQEGEISKLEITLDKNGIKANKFHLVEDKQIILDLMDVEANPKIMRAMDTSEFSGSVVFVSPYKKPGDKKSIRFAIQLRDNARSVLETVSNKIVLSIENRFGVFTQKRLEKAEGNELAIQDGEVTSVLNVPKSNKLEDILQNITLSGKKKYVGKKITINVQNLKVSEILKMIADVSGFNIILDDSVNAVKPISLSLTNVPWDEILDTVLDLGKLVANKRGNILIVNTVDKAIQEREAELKAQELSKEQEPLVTKIFLISYAKLADISKIINDYLTPKRGSLALDERTNSLIIKDTIESIDKIRKIIETLDTQTPQILIQSKIVEMTEGYSKEFGLSEGLKFSYDPIGTPGTEPAATVGSEVSGDVERAGPGFTFATAPIPGTQSLSTLTIGRLGRVLDLGFTLNLMESESKGRVVSSPKVITQNKTPATISSTETTSFLVTQTTDNSTTNTFENVAANLQLQVTPQVTNEGAIVLDIQVDKDEFGERPSANAPPNRTSRSVKTNVLVDNGSTIVIGGVYKTATSDTHSGIPFLKDIPLVGWLFRTSHKPTSSKSEMVIFITPRIINQEEAGLIGQDDAISG